MDKDTHSNAYWNLVCAQIKKYNILKNKIKYFIYRNSISFSHRMKDMLLVWRNPPGIDGLIWSFGPDVIHATLQNLTTSIFLQLKSHISTKILSLSLCPTGWKRGCRPKQTYPTSRRRPREIGREIGHRHRQISRGFPGCRWIRTVSTRVRYAAWFFFSLTVNKIT